MGGINGKSNLKPLVIFVACIAVLVAGVSALRGGFFSKGQSVEPHVTNKTTSVQISNIRPLRSGDFELTFRNQSDKAIYAYTVITAEKPTRKGMTIFATGAPVQPGESKSERIPGSNLNSSAANPAAGREIVFSSVYLEGGTTEGDAGDSEKLKQTMAGMKEQAALVVQVLRSAVASSKQDSGLLDAIESQVTLMSVRDEHAPPSREHDYGKANVNDRLREEIERLRTRNTGPALKDHLSRLISYYERLAEKL
ncbi:MAG TPA: hypothetical protein VN696_06475 [Pyrinomonadaceae bacterium]|nr:hypothetical protein [Pyrinomonadaceae bacterium]